MNKELAKLLGLSVDASEEQIAERVAVLAEDSRKREEAEAKLETTNKTLAELRAQQEAEKVAARELEVKRIDDDARARGLWEPGSDRQKHFMDLAAKDLELARTFVALLTPQNPVGATRQATPDNTPPAAPKGDLAATLSKEYGSMYGYSDEFAGVFANSLAQLGVDADMLKEYGPEAIQRKEALHRDDWSAAMRGERN